MNNCLLKETDLRHNKDFYFFLHTEFNSIEIEKECSIVEFV
jgi:hypothetical protein